MMLPPTPRFEQSEPASSAGTTQTLPKSPWITAGMDFIQALPLTSLRASTKHITEMTYRLLLAPLLALVLPVLTANASGLKDAPELGKRFEEAGVKGTFVLYRVNEDSFQIYNLERAKT